MKQGIWLAFDLGVKGDYESLYKWLDSKSALECGDNIAYVDFEYEADMVTEITGSLHANVRMTPASRFYLVAKGLAADQVAGRFIIGTRKAPPWTGFGPQQGVTQPDAS